MQGWLATWIAHHDEEAYAESVPAHAQRELSAYLECGILAHGFARARCPDCTAEFLIAFSRKGRGVCPSCTTERMAATAAHLVDSVIPRVPMWQWVLALPKRLRPALRNHAALAMRVLRIFIGSMVGREPAQLHRADSAGCAWWNPRVLWFGTFHLISRAGSTLPHCAADVAAAACSSSPSSPSAP